MEIRKVGLIGLGAVGMNFGEHLLDAGADLLVIADEGRIARFKEEGVYSNGKKIEFTYASPKEAQEVDLLLIATKIGGLRGAMETAAPFIGAHTLLVCLINGITSESLLAERFGGENVLYSVAQGMDAVKVGNQLTYTNSGRIVLGEKEPGPVSARVQAVADYLNSHGVTCQPVEDMVRRQWGKLMLNVGLNQACMVFEGDYSAVQKPGRARDTMLGAMREAQTLAALEGFAISEAEFDEWVAMVDGLAPEGKPSMRQDGEAHRKSEVELFADTMIRLGEKHGVPVPVNRWLYERVMEMEAAY